MLVAGNKVKNITIENADQTISTKKAVKYLGVLFDHNYRMTEHVKYITAKTEKTVSALGRIMPNIGGPSPSKRRILMSAANSIILYAAPVWKKAIEHKKYRDMLKQTQRRMLIRVCSAYRTASTVALGVIAGAPPIDLLLAERARIHDSISTKTELREETERAWQERWNRTEDEAQWSRKMFPEISRWAKRRHGEIGYYLTQALTGHGCYGTYLKRIGKEETEACWYCGAEKDDPAHTHCSNVKDGRHSVFN